MKELENIMARFEKIFPYERYGNGGCIDVALTRYEHTGKLGWLIFVHKPSGGLRRFKTIDALESWLSHHELLFRRF